MRHSKSFIQYTARYWEGKVRSNGGRGRQAAHYSSRRWRMHWSPGVVDNFRCFNIFEPSISATTCFKVYSAWGSSHPFHKENGQPHYSAPPGLSARWCGGDEKSQQHPDKNAFSWTALCAVCTTAVSWLASWVALLNISFLPVHPI